MGPAFPSFSLNLGASSGSNGQQLGTTFPAVHALQSLGPVPSSAGPSGFTFPNLAAGLNSPSTTSLLGVPNMLFDNGVMVSTDTFATDQDAFNNLNSTKNSPTYPLRISPPHMRLSPAVVPNWPHSPPHMRLSPAAFANWPQSPTHTKQELNTENLGPIPFGSSSNEIPSASATVPDLKQEISDTISTKKKKRKHTDRACTHCYKAKAGCDAERPCQRCIRLGKQQCVDRRKTPEIPMVVLKTRVHFLLRGLKKKFYSLARVNVADLDGIYTVLWHVLMNIKIDRGLNSEVFLFGIVYPRIFSGFYAKVGTLTGIPRARAILDILWLELQFLTSQEKRTPPRTPPRSLMKQISILESCVDEIYHIQRTRNLFVPDMVTFSPLPIPRDFRGDMETESD